MAVITSHERINEVNRENNHLRDSVQKAGFTHPWLVTAIPARGGRMW
jgi:hypothetical protein